MPVKLLKNTKNVNEVAIFWKEHSDLVHLMGLYALKKHCEEHNFSSEEFKAYKQGLGEIPLLMKMCHDSFLASQKEAKKGL